MSHGEIIRLLCRNITANAFKYQYIMNELKNYMNPNIVVANHVINIDIIGSSRIFFY